MKIDISKDETGEWLDVVFAVSVGLGSTGSHESEFLQRELIARLQSCGEQGTSLGSPPGDGAKLFSIKLSLGPQTQCPGQGRPTALLSSSHIPSYC